MVGGQVTTLATMDPLNTRMSQRVLPGVSTALVRSIVAVQDQRKRLPPKPNNQHTLLDFCQRCSRTDADVGGRRGRTPGFAANASCCSLHCDDNGPTIKECCMMEKGDVDVGKCSASCARPEPSESGRVDLAGTYLVWLAPYQRRRRALLSIKDIQGEPIIPFGLFRLWHTSQHTLLLRGTLAHIPSICDTPSILPAVAPV